MQSDTFRNLGLLFFAGFFFYLLFVIDALMAYKTIISHFNFNCCQEMLNLTINYENIMYLIGIYYQNRAKQEKNINAEQYV